MTTASLKFLAVNFSLAVFALIVGALFSGCSSTGGYGPCTGYYQRKARGIAVLRGAVVHADLPGYVFSPTSNDMASAIGIANAEDLRNRQVALEAFFGGRTYAALSDIAVELWPVMYRVAEAVDYVGIPVGVGWGLYELADGINSSGDRGDDNSHRTVYNIDTGGGDAHLGDGDSDKSSNVEQSSDYDYSYSSSESHSGGESE